MFVNTGFWNLLNALGFLDFPIIRGVNLWWPVAFVQLKTVNLCFAIFNPGAVFFDKET